MVTTKTCQHCGNPIQVKRLTKKYCDDNCKQAAYFKRINNRNDESTYGVKLTLTDATNPPLSQNLSASPTVQDIILQDISAKLTQLIGVNGDSPFILKPEVGSGFKSIVVLKFEL